MGITTTEDEQKANERAMGILLITVDGNSLDNIQDCKTVKEMWDTLKDSHTHFDLWDGMLALKVYANIEKKVEMQHIAVQSSWFWH